MVEEVEAGRWPDGVEADSTKRFMRENLAGGRYLQMPKPTLETTGRGRRSWHASCVHACRDLGMSASTHIMHQASVFVEASGSKRSSAEAGAGAAVALQSWPSPSQSSGSRTRQSGTPQSRSRCRSRRMSGGAEAQGPACQDVHGAHGKHPSFVDRLQTLHPA